jgi:hypothetical protein
MYLNGPSQVEEPDIIMAVFLQSATFLNSGRLLALSSGGYWTRGSVCAVGSGDETSVARWQAV